MIPGDPRNGHVYRKNRDLRLAQPDGHICGICGHGGAETVDHIISRHTWLLIHGNYKGLNDLSNLQPAHGTKGRINNRCMVCVAAGGTGMCNQTKGSTQVTGGVRSRQW